MNLYIVRHGNPDYGRECLTDLGHIQAEACAEEMLGLKIDEIISSPMGRAVETAEHIATKIGCEIQIEPWLEEIEHYGYNPDGNLTRAVQMDPTFLRSPEVEAMGADWAKHPAFNGEQTAHEMVDRIYSGARDLLERYGYVEEGSRFRIETPSEKNIAVYSHAGTFLVLAGYLLRLPELISWHSFFVRQTGISWVNLNNFDSGYTVPRFYSMGQTDHLARRGIEIT